MLSGPPCDDGMTLYANPWIGSFSLEHFWPWPAPPDPFPRHRAAAQALNQLQRTRETHLYFRNTLPEGLPALPGTFPLYRGNTKYHPFDFHIVSDSLVEQYILHPGKIRCLRHEVSENSQQCIVERDFKVDLAGPIHVVATGNKRFVIAESGAVCRIPADAKTGDKLTPIWSGSPILALITDSKRGKSFAFTADEYFEIADRIRPKAHTLTSILRRNRGELIEAVADCARAASKMP